MELADTSAWTNRHKHAAVRAEFDARVLAGEIATCALVEMELLWTARSRADFDALRQELAALRHVEIPQRAWQRAKEIWGELASQGRHRQVPYVDLVIAAAAEVAGIGLCHYDQDFEVIAALSGQPERPIAPIGTL